LARPRGFRTVLRCEGSSSLLAGLEGRLVRRGLVGNRNNVFPGQAGFHWGSDIIFDHSGISV
ncbi:unnamed protein product, partial [Tuber aestivum]